MDDPNSNYYKGRAYKHEGDNGPQPAALGLWDQINNSDIVKRLRRCLRAV